MKKLLAIEYDGIITHIYQFNDVNDILDEEIDDFLSNLGNPDIEVLPSEYYPQYSLVIRIDIISNTIHNDFITDIELFLKTTFKIFSKNN